MRNTIAILFLTTIGLLTAGCNRHDGHDHGEGGHGHHGSAEIELPGLSVTEWTDKTELFMENRALVQGRETSFAVHLTDLESFKPVTRGKVALRFQGSDGKEFVFEASSPTSPGIFRPVAKIPQAGEFALVLELSGAQAQDTHDLGTIRVYTDAHAAVESNPEESGSGGTISFLKEQQWNAEFDVQEVKKRKLSETITAQGQVRAPLGKSTQVKAPAAGRVEGGPHQFPLVGSAVKQGQIVAQIVQDGSEPIDVAAPVSGVIVVVHAGIGDTVQEGWKLFDIVDMSRVWIEARVYEPDVPSIPTNARAYVEFPGSDKRLETRRLVSLGGSLDAASRTVEVLFEAGNPGGMLKVGNTVTVRIRTRKTSSGPAIPRDAIIDEDGVPVAYVQTEGESFERRKLILGVRESDWVQVLDGLKEGERIATKGAYLVRLASASSQLPAHGHAH